MDKQGASTTSSIPLLVAIIEALTQQTALIGLISKPGRIVVHFDPSSRQKPVTLEFDFKV